MSDYIVEYKTNSYKSWDKIIDSECDLEEFVQDNLNTDPWGYEGGELESLRSKLNALSELHSRLLCMLFEKEVLTEQELFKFLYVNQDKYKEAKIIKK